MEQTAIIVNGIGEKQIKQVKLYVRIVKHHYESDLLKLPEQQRNIIASHIVNFMRSIYLAEHPFDEIELAEQRTIEAKHVVNYLQLPKTAELFSRIKVCIDLDNMISLCAKNYKDYKDNCLRLSDKQQLFVEHKQKTICSRYHIDSSRLLQAPMQKKETVKYKRNRKVAQIDMDGRIINVFDSLPSAAKNTGISSDCISNCCKGISRSSKGYVFRFLDEDIDF